jgi:hypothetical protein
MWSILIMFSLVLALAVAVKQITGAFTKAQTFPTCEYATQNGFFPGPAVPLQSKKKYRNTILM